MGLDGIEPGEKPAIELVGEDFYMSDAGDTDSESEESDAGNETTLADGDQNSDDDHGYNDSASDSEESEPPCKRLRTGFQQSFPAKRPQCHDGDDDEDLGSRAVERKSLIVRLPTPAPRRLTPLAMPEVRSTRSRLQGRPCKPIIKVEPIDLTADQAPAPIEEDRKTPAATEDPNTGVPFPVTAEDHEEDEEAVERKLRAKRKELKVARLEWGESILEEKLRVKKTSS